MSTDPSDPVATPPASAGRWADLKPRILSAIALVVVGFLAIWAGGIVFTGFVALAVGIMIWELARMLKSDAALLLAGVGGLCILGLALLPLGWGLPLVILPVLVGIGRIEKDRLAFALFSVMIVLAGYGLIHLRHDLGTIWLVWLMLVVIVTDVFGYFAGKMIGGPKFWPKVSPKKTWSGTVAGWVGAALVGVCFVIWGNALSSIIGISIALSMASQMGDIAESAIKRRSGVKDSSNLLPGHGGFFDRFDGVLGASVFLLLVEQIVNFPPVAL